MVTITDANRMATFLINKNRNYSCTVPVPAKTTGAANFGDAMMVMVAIKDNTGSGVAGCYTGREPKIREHRHCAPPQPTALYSVQPYYDKTTFF